MIREVIGHKSHPAGMNDYLQVIAIDEPGPGGAHHHYNISGPAEFPNSPIVSCDINFQCGPVEANKPSGISNESLLAVVLDRLECFQRGEFSCRENAIAITKLQEVMHWLQHRTADRVRRGVEGTLSK